MGCVGCPLAWNLTHALRLYGNVEKKNRVCTSCASASEIDNALLDERVLVVQLTYLDEISCVVSGPSRLPQSCLSTVRKVLHDCVGSSRRSHTNILGVQEVGTPPQKQTKHTHIDSAISPQHKSQGVRGPGACRPHLAKRLLL